MILDERLELLDAGALLTSGTGRLLVGDVIDLGVAGAGTVGAGSAPGDIGNTAIFEGMALAIQVTTAVTSAGSATVSFELSSDAQAAIAVDGTATLHVKSFDIPKATLIAGYTVRLPLPGHMPAYERYLGLVQNVGTAALTAGAVNAFIARDVGSWQALPDAV